MMTPSLRSVHDIMFSIWRTYRILPVLLFSSRQHSICMLIYAVTRPSVRPSVCQSVTHGWISQKQLKLGL